MKKLMNKVAGFMKNEGGQGVVEYALIFGLVASRDCSPEVPGPAVNSGKSVFLFGPPGNGKTIL